MIRRLTPVSGEPSGTEGFILVEILIGLAILGVALGYVYQTFSGAFLWLDQGSRSATARHLAQSLLERVGHDLALTEGEITGRTPDGFTWRIAMAPHEVVVRPTGDSLASYAVRATVGWTSASSRPRHIALTTVVLPPPGHAQ